jgi:probable rRNA maturation factor
MIHIQIISQYETRFHEELIHQYVDQTLAYLDIKNVELALVINDNKGVHELNRDYRHIDAPTDVLSFIYDMEDPESNLRYLGDIIISGDKVMEQATQAGHSPEKELCTLIVHGILHLIGYDHETESAKPIMLPLQDKILKAIFPDDI